MLLIFFGFLILVFLTYQSYKHFFPSPNVDPRGKYVLISGCDTGFGHGLAVELDKQGFNIFAGLYDMKNEALLKDKLSSRATIFRLDITRKEDVDAAYILVTKKTDTLHALVNNAGIITSGFIDWISIETMHLTMNVNFFGHVAMTKKFLSLLLVQKNSRVVNISSTSGFFATPTFSAYCASKFALESFSDCLRREMSAWGLRVSIIEPSAMKTPLIQGQEQALRNLWAKLAPDVRERWGEAFFNMQLEEFNNGFLAKAAEDPIQVVQVLQHAVMNTSPRIRYRVGRLSKFLDFPLSIIPAWIADLPFSKLHNSGVVPTGIQKQRK